MTVRVLDDDRAGYAILLFDTPVDSASIRLAIRSLHVHDGAYVGPGGSWAKAAHYFAALRVETEDGRLGYRVGPEVVNHLLEFDRIEARSEDGALCEEGVWENAVPSMLFGRDHPTVVGPGPTEVAPPQPPAPPLPPPPVPPLPPQPPASTPPPPPIEDRVTGDDEARDPVEGPRPVRRKIPLWIPAVGVGAVVLAAAAAIALVPALRCGVLRLGCPVVEPLVVETPEQARAREARGCADRKQAAGEHCLVEQVCLAPYRMQFPNGSAIADFDKIALRARERCPPPPDDTDRRVLEERALAEARKCAKANPCATQACYDEYLRALGGGAEGAVRNEMELALRGCRPPPLPEPVEQSPLPDGIYIARARAGGCGAKTQSVPVTVRSGRISWRHDGPQVRNMPWSGRIEADGTITASFGNSPDFVAKGRYSGEEREVTMRFPDCREPVTMTIFNRID